MLVNLYVSSSSISYSPAFTSAVLVVPELDVVEFEGAAEVWVFLAEPQATAKQHTIAMIKICGLMLGGL